MKAIEGDKMSALSLRLPDSVHRHINDRIYHKWAEAVQGVRPDPVLFLFFSSEDCQS